MNTSQKEVLSIINDLSTDTDIVETVNKIENGLSTTKGNYGSYMAILSPIASDKTVLMILASAMIKAGANRFGVTSAYKLLA